MSGSSPTAAVTTVAGSPLSGRPMQATIASTDLVFMLVQVGTVLVPSLVAGSTLLASVLGLGGGTLTGPLTLSGAPTEPLQAATKAYVDAITATAASALLGANAAASQAEAAVAAVQAGTGLAIEAFRGAPNGVAALDPAGTLLLSNKAALAIDATGHVVVAAVVEDTNDGFEPVAGSRVLYTDGGILKVAT